MELIFENVCVAVCCSLENVCCRVLWCVAVFCSKMNSTINLTLENVCCSVLQRVAVSRMCVLGCCGALQCVE